jgi:hypothetical protein
MTFLEAINAVLRRLREDEVVSSNSTDYSKLIGDFVNQSIYECEHSWDWNCLKDTITVTTAASTQSYNFHNADVKIIEAVNDTKDWYMKVIPADYQMSHDYVINLQDGSPYFYSFSGKSGDYSQIKLTPTPTGVESIVFSVIKYTPEKEIDGTDDTDTITIPSLPVVLNAYARAVSERGEDGGIGINKADMDYRQTLADAISMDAGLNHPLEHSWHVI